MDDATVRQIESDPNFKKLVHERGTLGWTLTIIMLVIYYGFIALVAFAPSVIAVKLAGSITAELAVQTLGQAGQHNIHQLFAHDDLKMECSAGLRRYAVRNGRGRSFFVLNSF